MSYVQKIAFVHTYGRAELHCRGLEADEFETQNIRKQNTPTESLTLRQARTLIEVQQCQLVYTFTYL